MATFNFNGSESITTPFNATIDRVIFNLNAEDIVSVTEDRGNNVVTFTAASGAVLTLTNTNFLAIGAAQPGALTPGNNSDIIFAIGTVGSETLTGNIVIGLEGDDTLTGLTNQEGRPGGLLIGNQGDDDLSNGNLTSVRMFGGRGADTLTLTTDAGSDESVLVGGLGTDTIVVAGGVAGYQGSVTVFGGNEANDPTDGADDITVTLGAGGEALIAGNGGDDEITINGIGVPGTAGAAGGQATVFGGQGNDTIDATVEGGQFIGGLGTDTINITSTGAQGNAFTIIGGNDANDPADGRDEITVALQDDDTALITGNGGNDLINLTGGAAEVTVFGGQGNDEIIGTVGDNSLIVGGLGNDEIAIDVANSGTVGSHVTVLGGNGMADAADGADLITVGLAGNVRASGVDGAAAQTATIFGNGGNDTIILTGQGAASVHGGQGADVIDINGIGLYTLTGGQGSDRFDFASSPAGVNGVNGGVLNANTVVADVSQITDLNFDEDELALGNTITFTATSTTIAPAGSTLQEAALNAFNQATTVGSGLPETGDDAAVIFAFQGQQFLVSGAVGSAGTPGTPGTPGTSPTAPVSGTIDSLINITGFTGTIDTNDFVGV